jgi:hypothetical protein
MPDPLRQSLSATQSPALFHASPYVTRWMLLRHFIHGDAIDSHEHNRMNWGSKMQPLLLAQAAEDLHLEVRPNADDAYVRRGQLGCTRDAEIICPDRGPGALETKCCFDFGTWMRDWNGGKELPKHIEIQTQQQMQVGDGETSYGWAVIAVWVCGEVHYFERKPIPELWTALEHEAGVFFADVEAKREGDPFGDPVEVPLLNRLFTPTAGLTIDLSEHPKANELSEEARMMIWHSTERLGHERAEKMAKAHFKALLGDAEAATLPGGVRITQKLIERAGYTVKPSRYTTIDAFVPEGAALPSKPEAAGTTL